MKSLNDDELTSMLSQAKAESPKPSPGFTARTMRAYEARFDGTRGWRRILFGSVRVPILAAVSGAAILLATGAALGLSMNRQQEVIERRSVAETLDGDRPVLNLYGLRPVPELRLRVIRRANETR